MGLEELKRYHKLVIVLVVALVVVVLAWYLLQRGPELPKPEEVLAKVTSASKELKTYKIEMKVTTTVKVRGQTQAMEFKGTGEVDRESKKLHMEFTFKVGEYEAEQEIYVIGNTMYMEIMGKWYKFSAPGIWESQEFVNATLKVMKHMKAEVKGVERVDDREAYKLVVKPSGISEEELTKLLLNASGITGISSMTELSALWKNMTFKSFELEMWVDKETGVLLKSKTKLTIELKIGGMVSSITSETELKIKDINVPISIELPPEAKKARPIERHETIGKLSLTGWDIA